MGISISNQLLGSTGLSVGLGLSRGNGLSFGGFAGGPALNLPFALTGTLDPRITFSRPSLATMYDSTGKLTYAPNNLLTFSQDFTNAAWASANTPIRTSGQIDPAGGTTATKLDLDVNDGIFQFCGSRAGNFIFSIWVRGDSAGTTRLSDASSGAFDISVNVTTAWTRVNTGSRAISGFFSPYLYRGAGDLATVYVAFSQLEQVTYQTTPSTYNATTSAAYYGPRFDYNPATLVARGLLIEEARTNSCLYSKTNVANWTVSGTTLAADNATAPDGTTSASRLTVSASPNAIFYSTAITTTAAPWTQSFFVKAGTASWVFIRSCDNASDSWFNVSTGVVGTAGAGCTTTITPIGDGWYRCTVAKTVVATASGFSVIGISNGDNVTTATAGQTIFVWGSQAELGSFATSYILTAASPLARSADSASMTGTNFSSWYNQTQGTFVVAGDVFGAIGSELPTFVNVNDTTLSNYIRLNAASTYRLRQFVNAGGSQQTQNTTGSAPVLNQQFKFGAAYNLNDFAVVADGGAVNPDATGTVPTVTQVNFGVWFGSAGTFLNGHIASLAYYNTRLPNATLQSLTT